MYLPIILAQLGLTGEFGNKLLWVNSPVQETVINKEAYLWLDSFGKVIYIAQKKDGAKDCALWDAGVYRYFMWLFVFRDYLHALLGQKVSEPQVETTCDAIAA